MWFSTVTIVSILQSAEKQLQYINGYNVAFQLLFLMLLRENELHRSFYFICSVVRLQSVHLAY